jgi:hypothetical protein
LSSEIKLRAFTEKILEFEFNVENHLLINLLSLVELKIMIDFLDLKLSKICLKMILEKKNLEK